jgi:hypothetical protein
MRFHYKPTSCGVRVSWRARAGDRIEYSAFLRSFRQDPKVTRAELSDSIQKVTPRPAPNAIHVDGRLYYSASDPALRRVRMRWRLHRSRVISVEHCQY